MRIWFLHTQTLAPNIPLWYHNVPMTSPDAPSTARFSYLSGNPKIRKTAAYFLTFLTLGMIAAVWGPTLPGLAEHTQTTLSQVSFLLAAYPLGRVLGFLAGGQLFDRMPGHPVMGLAVLSAATALVLVPLIPLLWLLGAVMLLLGICTGAIGVGGNTLLMWVHGHDVAPFMNGMHFCFGTGAFLAPIIVAQLVQASGDIVWAYWALALLAIPAALALLLQPSPESPAVLATGPVERIRALPVSLIALFFFCFIGAEFGFGWWLFTYVVKMDLGAAPIAALLTALYWGSMAFGRLLAALFSVRFSPRAILQVCLVGSLVSLGVIMLWPQSQVAISAGTFGTGMTIGPLFPGMMAFAERRMVITGRVTSFFLVGGSLGAMSIPWLIGQVFESVGPMTTMVAVAAAMAMTTGTFAVLVWVTRDQIGERTEIAPG